jgi:hypothetical protein
MMEKERVHAGAPPKTMWKSFFLASGLFACMLGIELLVIDSATILPLNGRGSSHVFTAPDWAPWTLISAGAVTILHFATLPKALIKD